MRGSRARKKRLDTCQALFLCRRGEPDHHDGFAQLLHAADDVPGAGRAPIPKGDEQIACLRHLVIAAHACGLPKALPGRGEAARADMVLERPAKAELIGAPGATVDDFGDAVALRCQRLTQQLIVGERARTGVAP